MKEIHVETCSSDPDIVTEKEDTEESKGCCECVLSMYNTLISIKSNCDRKGFKVGRLLGFHDKDCQNKIDYNLQRTLSSYVICYVMLWLYELGL